MRQALDPVLHHLEVLTGNCLNRDLFCDTLVRLQLSTLIIRGTPEWLAIWNSTPVVRVGTENLGPRGRSRKGELMAAVAMLTSGYTLPSPAKRLPMLWSRSRAACAASTRPGPDSEKRRNPTPAVELMHATGICGPLTAAYIPGGEGVGQLGDGQRVYLAMKPPLGAVAKRTLFAGDEIWPAAESLPDDQLIALGISGTGALVPLDETRIAPGESVLIFGATGRVGLLGRPHGKIVVAR